MEVRTGEGILYCSFFFGQTGQVLRAWTDNTKEIPFAVFLFFFYAIFIILRGIQSKGFAPIRTHIHTHISLSLSLPVPVMCFSS